MRNASGERIDDFQARGRLAPRQVLGVQASHARVQTRGDDQGVPERVAKFNVKPFGSHQCRWRRHDERIHSEEALEPSPRQFTTESARFESPACAHKLNRNLPENYCVRSISNKLHGAFVPPSVVLVAEIQQDVRVKGDHRTLRERACEPATSGSCGPLPRAIRETPTDARLHCAQRPANPIRSVRAPRSRPAAARSGPAPQGASVRRSHISLQRFASSYLIIVQYGHEHNAPCLQGKVLS